MDTICFALAGYLSGSILFAQIFSKMLHKTNAIAQSSDGNPGTANAFVHGGFLCGVLTLLGDLIKGAVPVHLYLVHTGGCAAPPAGLALVMAAPVVGHIFPIYTRFHGGKGIAVTFGCLIGLLPIWKPLILLAGFFLIFTLCIRIFPHLHRTAAAYICTSAGLIVSEGAVPVLMGFHIIAAVVCIKLWMSREANVRMRVKLFWMR